MATKNPIAVNAEVVNAEVVNAEVVPQKVEEISSAKTGVDANIILLTLQTISNKVFLLDFLAKSPMYKFCLFALWVGFASIIYFSFAKDEKNKNLSSQTIFLLQCSAVWILLLAFSFLFVMK